MQTRISRSDLKISLGITAVHLVITLLRQDRMEVAQGAGWDGREYLLMAMGEPPSGLPYTLRIGLPFVARHFVSNDLLFNFELINLLAGIVFSVAAFLLVAAALEQASLLTKLTGWALLTMTDLSPISFSVWYPAQTDSATDALLIVLLLVVFTKSISSTTRYALFSFAVFFLGTMVRENFAAFLAYVGARSFGRTLTAVLGGGLGAALALALIGRVTGLDPTDKTASFYTFLHWHPLVPALAAIISIYGSALMFAVISRAAAVAPVPPKDPAQRGYAELGFVVALMMALGGGSNPGRYLFWSLPIVVVRVVPHIEALIRERRYIAWLSGVAFMLAFQRAFVPIEPTGMAGCGIDAFLTGHGTWIGHWTTECTRESSMSLLVFYGAACLVAAAVAYLSCALADLMARRSAGAH